MPNVRLDQPIILLVEDNSDDEEMACRAIRQQAPGAQVAIARDGEDAVKCMSGDLYFDDRKVQAIPNLIVLDLKLPKVSGLEVLKSIRKSEATQFVPVVVFSSSDERRDVDRAYALGANTYVRKPTEYDEYIQTVKDLTQYWFEIASLPSTA